MRDAVDHQPHAELLSGLERFTNGLRRPLRIWPYTWESLRWFGGAFVAMTLVWTLAGLAVVEWFEPSRLGRAEADLSRWLADNRTDTMDTVADLLSVPSDTPVKIALMVLLAVAFPLVFRRWHDWAFLLGALVLEVCVYGLSSFLVSRPRPPVERLTEAPTESFPSGHMAAAVTFYVGLVLIVHWHTADARVRAAAWAFGVLIPAGMLVSRLYLGMHYLSDMIGGILLGLTALAVALWIAQRGISDTIDDHSGAVPDHVEALDIHDHASS